jgi:hypothetical protein
MDILFMDIGGYFRLHYHMLLVVISGYYINGYWWLFYNITWNNILVWIIVYSFEKEKTMLATNNFLFQDGADVVYLSMDNHKTFNTKKIWCYLSNLDYPLGFLAKSFFK